MFFKDIVPKSLRLVFGAPKTESLSGFDRDYYLAHNPDVAESGVDPLKHYLEHGWREGREPSAGFSGQSYLAGNPDVEASGLNPLVHYLNHGLAEGRPGAGSASNSADQQQRQPAPASRDLNEWRMDWHSPEPTRLI